MSDFDLSKVMNGWTQEGILGSGAFGTVYLARNTETGAFSAVKVIKTPPSQEAVDNALKLGIGRELLSTYFGKFKNDLSWELTMYKTVKSQHLETVEDIITVDAEGPGWAGYIRKGIYTPMAVYFDKAPATQEDAARLGVEIASALDALTQYTMVHGEVKPENVFVSDTGEFVLGDYGVRRCLEKAGSGIFSAEEDGFEAPEVGQDRLYTARSDIYSLGALMAYTANGCQMPPNRDPGAIRDLDPAFAAIIKKAMAADPKERYQTAMQLKLELQRLTLGKKPPRRAMAAAAAFDAVKRNGGAAITSGAVITGRGVTREKPAPAKPAASGRTDTVEDTARAAAENTETMKRKNAKAGAVVALAAALLVLAVVLLVMVPWKTGGPAETIPMKTSGQNASGSGSSSGSGSPSGSGSSQPPASGTTSSEPPVSESTPSEPPATETTPTTEPKPTESKPTEPKPTETKPTEPKPTKPQPTNNDILFPSDTKLITREFLETKTRSEIGYIVNEMYARHGFIFKEGGEYAAYFESQKWYKPVTNSQNKVTDEFSDIEWQNLATITGYQKEMGWRDTAVTVPTKPSEPPTTEPPTTEPPATEPPTTEPPTTEPPATEPPATEPPSTKPAEEQYLYPTDKQLITREELEGMTRSEIGYIVNEMYARHGYIFSVAEYKTYFESQSWYRPMTDNSEFAFSMFNEAERQNMTFITAYQKEMGWK